MVSIFDLAKQRNEQMGPGIVAPIGRAEMMEAGRLALRGAFASRCMAALMPDLDLYERVEAADLRRAIQECAVLAVQAADALLAALTAPQVAAAPAATAHEQAQQ
jgi:hypothetical protein